MADFTGIDYTNEPIGLDPNGRSANVTAGTQELTTWTVSVSSSAIGASRGIPEPAVSIIHRSISGALEELFGGRLFEHVIILPRVKGLGYVISETQFSIEVWNTFRNSDQILTAIALSGSGGLSIVDPYGEPLTFAALDSRIYQATVPSAGAVSIDQDIVFTFPGIAGTDLLVTGSRIMVFSVAPDWASGVKESISFLTDVFKAYSDNEQRRGLRQIPRRGVKFRATALTARNAAGMESLLWGWQALPYAVPWWQDATALTADTPAGSFSIPCDTTDRQFAAGGIVIVWVDEYTFEALTIAAVFADHVTTTEATLLTWFAGKSTLVMPCFLARVGTSVKVDRLWSAADSIDLEFAGEAQQPAPTPSISLPTFKGFPVLEQSPNWISDLNRTYNRSIGLLDPKIGPITVISKAQTPIVEQEFPWYLENHAAVTKFRAFLLGQFGQLSPFWIPTWDQDLVLAHDLGSADTGVTIASEFYTRFLFPAKARRYLAFIPADGSGNVYAKVTAAVDVGDGTEILTLEAAPGKVFPKATTQVSFLTFARLASDDSEIEWFSNDLAQATLRFQEVPTEVP
jgi:hypothetical protein